MGELSGEECLAWAARDASGILSPYTFNRRALGGDDVSVKITHCGVCYADFVWSKNCLGDSKYPLVPGDCEQCNERLESHCSKNTYTFNGIDADGSVTKGGYSTAIVVLERYCYHIPEGYPLEKAAPLLCAGITVYTPMMRHKMNQPGKSLGVIGLGGLGHMAVKFGKAFGLNVTVFSTSPSKEDEALSVLGADRFVVSSDKQQMEALANSLDFIVDAASGDHPFDPYMSLLKVGGVLALVGFPREIRISPAILNLGARTISGSITGGTTDTQEMLNFCAANKIYPEVELIEMPYINKALERLVSKDVKYRFVIDVENSFKR